MSRGGITPLESLPLHMISYGREPLHLPTHHVQVAVTEERRCEFLLDTTFAVRPASARLPAANGTAGTAVRSRTVAPRLTIRLTQLYGVSMRLCCSHEASVKQNF